MPRLLVNANILVRQLTAAIQTASCCSRFLRVGSDAAGAKMMKLPYKWPSSKDVHVQLRYCGVTAIFYSIFKEKRIAADGWDRNSTRPRALASTPMENPRKIKIKCFFSYLQDSERQVILAASPPTTTTEKGKKNHILIPQDHKVSDRDGDISISQIISWHRTWESLPQRDPISWMRTTGGGSFGRRSAGVLVSA